MVGQSRRRGDLAHRASARAGADGWMNVDDRTHAWLGQKPEPVVFDSGETCETRDEVVMRRVP